MYFTNLCLYNETKKNKAGYWKEVSITDKVQDFCNTVSINLLDSIRSIGSAIITNVCCVDKHCLNKCHRVFKYSMSNTSRSIQGNIHRHLMKAVLKTCGFGLECFT